LADLYKEYLKDEGYDVEHVENGQEAIEAFSRSQPELVLLDLALPDMNGMEVLRSLKGDEPNVIIITAHGSLSNAIEAMQAGAAKLLDYISCGIAVSRHTLGDPLFFVADRFGILTVRHTAADDVFECRTGYDEFRAFRIDFPVFLIAPNQTVLGIVEHEPVGHRLDRIAQLLLGQPHFVLAARSPLHRCAKIQLDLTKVGEFCRHFFHLRELGCNCLFGVRDHFGATGQPAIPNQQGQHPTSQQNADGDANYVGKYPI